jgi:short-subunit dehydrogenase
MTNIAIFGATSKIAEETAALYASGSRFFLIGRNQAKLTQLADRLKRLGATDVTIKQLDLADPKLSAKEVVDEVLTKMNDIDLCLFAQGDLGRNETLMNDESATRTLFQLNTVNIIAFGNALVAKMDPGRQATIAIISSVAGERGKRNTLIYGASKAALTSFADGLRSHLGNTAINVLTILPGFVATPMTAHLKPSPLFATPEKVAKSIHRAIKTKKQKIYVPGWWWLIMTVFKLVPERLFVHLRM